MKKNILYIVIGLLLGITSMYIVNANELEIKQDIANAKAYLEKMFFTKDGDPGKDKVVQIYGTGSGKIEVGSASEVQINGDGSGTIDVGDHVKIDGDGSGKMNFEHVEIDGSGTIDVNGNKKINVGDPVKIDGDGSGKINVGNDNVKIDGDGSGKINVGNDNVKIDGDGTIDVQGVGNINADNEVKVGNNVTINKSGTIDVNGNGNISADNEVKVGNNAVTLDKDGNINADNNITAGNEVNAGNKVQVGGNNGIVLMSNGMAMIRGNGDGRLAATHSINVGGSPGVIINKEGNIEADNDISADNEIKVGNNIILKKNGSITASSLNGDIITDDIDYDNTATQIVGSARAISKVQQNVMAIDENTDDIDNNLRELENAIKSLSVNCTSSLSGTTVLTSCSLGGTTPPLNTSRAHDPLPHATTNNTNVVNQIVSCGPAADEKGYNINSSVYNGVKCIGGSVSGSLPSFPALGGTAQWTCENTSGSTETCELSRDSVENFVKDMIKDPDSVDCDSLDYESGSDFNKNFCEDNKNIAKTLKGFN